MKERIEIEAVDKFFRATVTTYRWIRDDVVRVYHSNGVVLRLTGMHWTCPDERHGKADPLLTARMHAALLEFSVAKLQECKAERHVAEQVDSIGREAKR